METIYTQNGYADREDYLDSLAEEYGLARGRVALIADMLGPTEDFDGLLVELEDLSALEG